YAGEHDHEVVAGARRDVALANVLEQKIAGRLYAGVRRLAVARSVHLLHSVDREPDHGHLRPGPSGARRLDEERLSRKRCVNNPVSPSRMVSPADLAGPCDASSSIRASKS